MSVEENPATASPATVLTEPPPQKRAHKPSAKARAAAAGAAEEGAAKEAPKKQAKRKKDTEKEVQAEKDGDATGHGTEEAELAAETPEASKKREQKAQVCVHLTAKQEAENIRKLHDHQYLHIADKLTLTSTAKSGASTAAEIRPGYFVTAWAQQPSHRKQRYCVYRIQKSTNAVHWNILGRFGLNKQLTSIPACEVITIERTEPLDTFDERKEFLAEYDEANGYLQQTAAEELQKLHKEVKERKKQKKSTSPKTAPTPGGTVSSGDFALLRQEMRDQLDLLRRDLRAQTEALATAMAELKHTTQLLRLQIESVKEISKHCVSLAIPQR